jgi:glucose-1-phosphatase
MIKTCLFDMGNVLVFFSHDRMRRQMGGLCGKTAADIQRLIFDSGLQWDYERGRLSRAEFHRQFELAVKQSVDPQALDFAVSDIFVLNSSIVPVIAALKARGLRLVLMSNTSIAHFEFIWKKYTILQQFDAFTVSYESDAIKPEHPIYERALNLIECAPEECFYTDDIAAYIEAAKPFGLDAELFTQTAALVEQLYARGIKLEINA